VRTAGPIRCRDIRSADLSRAGTGGCGVRKDLTTKFATAGQCENRHQVSSRGSSARMAAGVDVRVHPNTATPTARRRNVHWTKPTWADKRAPGSTATSRWEGAARKLFGGEGSGGCSIMDCHLYIGGVGSSTAKALSRRHHFPAQTSYKRLVPGFEAPIFNLAYSASNRFRPRSAFRKCSESEGPAENRSALSGFPTTTPYLAFAALPEWRGAEGRAEPRSSRRFDDKNLVRSRARHEAAKVAAPCASLEEAIDHLDKDRESHTRAACSPTKCSTANIGLKMEGGHRFRMTTHPEK